MSQVYPIWISNIQELDLIYEALHCINSNLNESFRVIQRNLHTLEYEYQMYANEEMLDTDEAKDILLRIKEKKAVTYQLAIKSEKIHRFLKRLSDPSVPQELVDEYKERKKRESILNIIQNQEKY